MIKVTLKDGSVREFENELSVLEIANAVGYENGSKFTSAFKESTGVTPSAYRKV